MRCACIALAILFAAPTFAADTRVLDDFENLSAWRAEHTDDTTAAVSAISGKHGKALRLTFDFDHVNGYATAHRALPLALPDNYELSFWVRGDAGANNLQFKLIDASGENVWWLNRPDFVFPHQWQQVRIRKRQIEFAWGPTRDRELKHSAALEFVVASGRDGGNGEVEFDELSIRRLRPEDNPPLPPTPNQTLQAAARNAPRGTYPRGFVEQSYWTIIGIDGGAAPALISEDGAIETKPGGWSIEPFLAVGDRRLTWADVTPVQSLAEGYLPMPAVQWKTDQLQFEVEAFARGTRESAQLFARYRLRNTSTTALAATLQLAIRPLQVNPPTQFLNITGGVSTIKRIQSNGTRIVIDDTPMVLSAAPAEIVRLGIDGKTMRAQAAADLRDAAGELSAALVYKFQLAAGGTEEIDLALPLSGAELLRALDPDSIECERMAVTAQWRERLNRVTLELPASAQRIADALRTALAHILISRDGVALRPGTRAYARSWIRDGAMMSDALLRLGETAAVRDYVGWYAPHQFSNGKVPCCVDHRGSDPVSENDSHGELIHAIAQLYRYGGDRAELEERWPHIQAAIAYMEKLRASQTGAENPAFQGLLPASISHEGYSAKPQHSYWDDFWALAGYRDAAEMAQLLGRPDAERYARMRDAFARDLHASLTAATQAPAIDYVPGSAELGDFDATSTTIALAPAAAQALIPDGLLTRTFERYWREFVARRDGATPWEDYTPYEWRSVGAFARLGWRARTQELVAFLFATGERPAAWNQWAEVVGHDPRKRRFIGDMPHAWVASDFIRSTLDLFAYERDGALVLAAGVPAAWLDGDGIAVEHLRTSYGELSYRLKRRRDRVELRIDAGAKPPGGFVLPWIAGTPRSVQVNGNAQPVPAGELRVAAAPARVVIENAGE